MPPPPPDADDAPTDDESAPPTATSLERRATAAFRKGRLGRARDLYTAALELEGGTAERPAAKWLALGNRAACLLRLERPREAEADCREALKQRAPANLLALCAVACMRQPGEAHLMAAFACCVEALYVEPQNAAARRVLADVRKAPGGRLLRPDTSARERLEQRMLRRGESGRIGYALAYFDALERPRPRTPSRTSASSSAGARRSRAASPSRSSRRRRVAPRRSTERIVPWGFMTRAF